MRKTMATTKPWKPPAESDLLHGAIAASGVRRVPEDSADEPRPSGRGQCRISPLRLRPQSANPAPRGLRSAIGRPRGSRGSTSPIPLPSETVPGSRADRQLVLARLSCGHAGGRDTRRGRTARAVRGPTGHTPSRGARPLGRGRFRLDPVPWSATAESRQPVPSSATAESRLGPALPCPAERDRRGETRSGPGDRGERFPAERWDQAGIGL
jgi:hypothetical protein